MPKEKWKKCSQCGAITDFDENNCPAGCLSGNMTPIELTFSEIQMLFQEEKVWTKWPSRFRTDKKNPPRQ